MSHSTFKMPTEAKIQEWKKQHGELHKITPDPKRPEIFCIVRHPKLIDIVSSSQLGGQDEVKIGELQLNDCWLDGDQRVKTDYELLSAAAKKMGGIFRVYDTKVEYLSITDELLKDIPADKHDRVKSDGEIRKLIVFVDGVEMAALLTKPNLLDVQKANTASNIVDEGTIYLQECWLMGHEELKSGSDEIRFAAYLAALNLLRRFVAEVEKL